MLRLNLGIASLLILSGLLHLCLWAFSGQEWEGAVSLRKPGLFGVSAGVTVWSLTWVLSCLHTRPWEQITLRCMNLALLIEVALITLQYWRGVPSHFNEATRLDSWIERGMLILILMVTVWIGWLCVRVMRPMAQSPAMALAIRSGMVWLLISCVLGIGTTVLGKWNLMHGRPYAIWGQAGVLKFPHGIALHAIQFLPLCAWLLERLKMREPYRIMRGLAHAQLCLVLFALWQTWQGKGRTDVDLFSGSLLVAAAVVVVWPLVRGPHN